MQLAGVRAGVLAVLEPWDYNTRRNPAGVPYRIAGGFNLYDLGSGKFTPSALVGVSATLPVLPVDGSPAARNLTSTLAIGLFWELDIDRRRPFDDGHHVLLTFGLDLGSLLSE